RSRFRAGINICCTFLPRLLLFFQLYAISAEPAQPFSRRNKYMLHFFAAIVAIFSIICYNKKNATINE
ncbi:hypothetical protein, partial [Ruminococcus flavefaciens]|uniref:hypothetical protein n=1 Tax=Ruminococcus flavefaciens TaxID=1265 RepID=UPI0026EA26FA